MSADRCKKNWNLKGNFDWTRKLFCTSLISLIQIYYRPVNRNTEYLKLTIFYTSKNRQRTCKSP
jgi:hypothetical protein